MPISTLSISSPVQLQGRIKLPASKSISNRALLINALSQNKELPDNLSDCDDTQVMLRALQEMPETIDIGAAGTAMRFLTAYLSVTPGTHVITGTERMRHRPIGILVDALRKLGAQIQYEGEEGFPPLRITGRTNLEGGKLTVAGDVSSQYISALLMIAPTLSHGLELTLTGDIASRPYLDMTLTMMCDFGAHAKWTSPTSIEVQPVPYTPRLYRIESDWSAASYWYEMMALAPQRDSWIELVGLTTESIQGDSRVWRWFNQLGVQTSPFHDDSDGTEGVCIRQGGHLTCFFQEDFSHQPDLAQTFAVTCSLQNVPFRLSGLQSLRIKETDRIEALKRELGKVVSLEAGPDYLEWKGNYNIDILDRMGHNLTFDTYEDHRMAMSLAPICMVLNEPIHINNPEVVSKSYPGFWSDLEKIGFYIACS